MKWREYYDKLRQWEAEGYDVSELKQKWFPEGGARGKSRARTVLSAVVVALVVVGGFFIWQHRSDAPPDDETVATLSTSIVPSVGGSVSPSSGTYDLGQEVILTASPASGYRFSHWSGDATGTGATTAITIGQNRHVIANFVPEDVAATVNGERITAEDVAETQARYDRYGMSMSFDQALEHLITEELLYQEAKDKGHALSTRDAESELETQLAVSGMTREELDSQLQLHGISYQEYLERFRRDFAIKDYLEATIEVTEEEAMARYDELKELYGDQLPPFEMVKQQIIAELQQEAMPSLIDELREKADIEVYM